MRVLFSLLLVCLLATLLPVQGDVFDSIARSVRTRLGHHNEHVPAVPAQDATQYTLPQMPGVVMPHAVDSQVDRPNKHKCKECTRWFAHHILKETVNQTLTFCAHTECPKMKARCDWIKKNLHFSIGYIAQKIRPHRSAQLFCEGAKKCAIPHHNKTDSYLPLVNDDTQSMYSSVEEDLEHVNDMFTGLDDTTRASVSSSSNDDVDVLGKADLMDGELDKDVNAIHFLENMYVDDYQDGANGIICGGCVHLGAAHVVSGIWNRTALFCKDPHNPEWRARCDWTFKHKEFSTGYIYSRFTPGKFSYGYCMGKGLCPHPKSSQQMTPTPMFDLGFGF